MVAIQQTIKTIKTVALILAIAVAIWFFKDWKTQTERNKITVENLRQLSKLDSLNFISQVFSKEEINHYLRDQNKYLLQKLEKDKIKLNRIESIVSSIYKYKDTVKTETDVSGILDYIKTNTPKQELFIDTTKCLTIKGFVKFDGQKLKVVFTEKEFNNKSDAVAYWERREWKFLGIKTRLFGRKEFTAVNYNECGESKTMKIEKTTN